MYFVLIAAAAALMLWFVTVWIRDANRFVVREYRLKEEKLKKPYRFILLSDLHNKSYGRGNEKLAAAVNAISADSVIVAGDMYTSQPGSGYDAALSLFQKIAGRRPVYYANGNHEHKTKVRIKTFGTMYESFFGRMKELGIEPLVNGHVFLPEYGIDICGLEIGEEYFRRFKKREFPPGYLEKLAGPARKDAFQILIAHNPDYFPEYTAWGAKLTLSGHIHGGVVRFPGLGGVISPSMRLFPKYDGGFFEENGAWMVLSRGLGMHTIPVRMWNPAEIVVVTLEP